jgi:gas vesicle protein
MDNQNGKYSGQALFFAFLGGAVAGAIAGILLATKSGEETRWELQDYAKKKQQDLLEKAKDVRAALDDVIERGKTLITEKRAGVEAAVKAGKEAAKNSISSTTGVAGQDRRAS